MALVSMPDSFAARYGRLVSVGNVGIWVGGGEKARERTGFSTAETVFCGVGVEVAFGLLGEDEGVLVGVFLGHLFCC